MEYANLNGEDTFKILQTSGRCMAMALGIILEESQGIVIELPYQELYPDDPNGKYLIWRDEEMVHIEPITEENWNELIDCENGQSVVVHAGTIH